MPKRLRQTLGIGCLLLAAACIVLFFHTIMQERAADELYTRNELVAAPATVIQPSASASTPAPQAAAAREKRFQRLQEQFPDLVAWISGPDLDYPVVQGEDNTFYLTHLADGSPNQAGSIFLEAGVPSDFSAEISCIYGHTMARDTMFSGLKRYREQVFCQQNPSFLLETPDGVGELTILGVCLRDGNDPYPTEFSSPESREEFLSWVREHSLVTPDVSVSDDPLVILSTCAYDFENARLAVVTQLEWREGEENT